MDAGTFPPFEEPFAVGVTPDGALAYVTDTGSSAVYAINTTSNEVIAVVNNTFTPFEEPDGIAIKLDLNPPENLQGIQKKNDFGLVFELYNQLMWEAPSSPFGVVGYFVYRDGTKIATLGGSTFQYSDHNRMKGVTTLYSVTSFASSGAESPPINAKVR